MPANRTATDIQGKRLDSRSDRNHPERVPVDQVDLATRDLRRVQVWFGDHVICSHAANPGEAERYARLMARRFAGLTVTVDDRPGAKDQGLPHELLWEQTVR